MSLDISRLADAIKANIIGCRGAPQDDARLTCFCTAIANGVVNEIQQHAVVLPTNLIDSLNGHVTGTGEVE